jgi:hypothetical protein
MHDVHRAGAEAGVHVGGNLLGGWRSRVSTQRTCAVRSRPGEPDPVPGLALAAFRRRLSVKGMHAGNGPATVRVMARDANRLVLEDPLTKPCPKAAEVSEPECRLAA